MTIEEHNACMTLKLNNNYGYNDNDNNDDYSYQKRHMRFKRSKNIVNHNNGNYNFIPGSSEVVERLWSMANKLMNENRSRTFPLLMESLLSLNENRRYWDIGVVQKAYKGKLSASVKNNMTEDE